MDTSDRLKAFEARLAALKQQMERGLVERAQTLRTLAERLRGGDDTVRRELKTQGHKLRGIAGSYGHHQLTEVAGNLEQRASISPPASVADLACNLADMAERIGQSAPAAVAAPPPKSVPSAPPVLRASTVPKRKIRVLAMDDDPVTRKLLTLTLRDIGGFDATIVSSGNEALALLSGATFNLVVSDAMMPDMNGREFCREARALNEACAQMPIVILSAATKDELGWSEALDARVTWLRKPFSPKALVADLEKILKTFAPK